MNGFFFKIGLPEVDIRMGVESMCLLDGFRCLTRPWIAKGGYQHCSRLGPAYLNRFRVPFFFFFFFQGPKRVQPGLTKGMQNPKQYRMPRSNT